MAMVSFVFSQDRIGFRERKIEVQIWKMQSRSSRSNFRRSQLAYPLLIRACHLPRVSDRAHIYDAPIGTIDET